MQLHVDTDQEPIAGLMLLSRLLMDYANMKAQNEKAAEAAYPSTLEQKEFVREVAEHTHSTQSVNKLATEGEPDPATLSSKSPFTVPTGATPTPPFANVVPLFPQPALNLPGATGPATLGVDTAGGAQAGTNMAPSTSTPAGSVAAAPGVVSAEVDKQGLPWDKRIHSSSKAKKGDGTWKIKRGLAAGVAEHVTAELMAAKLSPTLAGQTVGAQGAVNVPALPNTGAVAGASNVPQVTLPSATPVPVPSFPFAAGVLPHTGPVPVPGQSSQGAIPVAPVNPVVRFSQMMAKISNALGARAITQEQVTAAHRGQQLDQLQQAVLNPDKIPMIEAALGLV